MKQIDPLHHRSKTEINQWLKKRDWYKKYIDNLKIEHQDINERKKFILGEHGAMTISGAFCYNDTQEGSAYWLEKEYMFLKWYFYQDLEIKK